MAYMHLLHFGLLWPQNIFMWMTSKLWYIFIVQSLLCGGLTNLDVICSHSVRIQDLWEYFYCTLHLVIWRLSLLCFMLLIWLLLFCGFSQVKRCAEMSRKLRFFKDQIHKAGLLPSPNPASQPDIELEELEVSFILHFDKWISLFSPPYWMWRMPFIPLDLDSTCGAWAWADWNECEQWEIASII